MTAAGTQPFTINGRFLAQGVTGVQRYAREIVRHIDQILAERDVSPTLRGTIVCPAEHDPDYRLATIAMQTTRFPGNFAWDQIVLPPHSRGTLLSLCNQGPIVAANQIICIHDLNTILAPESYGWPFRLLYRMTQPRLARRATWVTTVSEFSAGALAGHGYCPREKVIVIPNGHEHVARWNAAHSHFSLEPHPRPYVFVLGSRARHKNVEILFPIARALDELGIDLLIAGGKADLFSQIAPASDSAQPNLHYLGFVSDDDLAALYQRALCFAFPSLTEGFGVPALEALALGCPVVASDIPSLQEVCGDAALYADPKAAETWLAAIRHLHENPEFAANLRQKGPLRARLFSWKTSAQKYLELLTATAGA